MGFYGNQRIQVAFVLKHLAPRDETDHFARVVWTCAIRRAH
jgi:hypothetical protein